MQSPQRLPATFASNQQQPVTVPKRGRDNSSNIKRFKTEVFGPNGFQKLFAMVERNPVIMYPPAGILAARERVMLLGDLREDLANATAADANNNATRDLDDIDRFFGNDPPSAPENAVQQQEQHPSVEDADEEADFLMRLKLLEDHRQRTREQRETINAAKPLTEGARTGSAPPPHDGAAIPNPVDALVLPGASSGLSDAEKAMYHQRQLAALIAHVYELNHTTFSKIQMKDALDRLRQCGKECYFNVVEFETVTRATQNAAFSNLEQVQEQRLTMQSLLQQGRDSYFGDQLELAEERVRQQEKEEEQDIHRGRDSSHNNNGEDDMMDDAELWDDLRRQQNNADVICEATADQQLHDTLQEGETFVAGSNNSDGEEKGHAAPEDTMEISESALMAPTALALPDANETSSHRFD